MPKENLIPINKQKLVEEIRELEESSWWQEYQSSISKSTLSPVARNKVISKSGSGFVSERGKEGYGPMPFVDESDALIVARSDEIISVLRQKAPVIAELLSDNRSGTLAFLKAKGALSVYRETLSDFGKSYTGSGVSWKVWSQYKEKIEDYVKELCRQWHDGQGNFVYRLQNPSKKLVDHIHNKYYEKLPRWPSVGGINIATIYLNISDLDKTPNDVFYIAWSCIGEVSVKDEHPVLNTFSADFRGNPEFKVLIFDLDEVRKLEGELGYLISQPGRSIEAAKREIERFQRSSYQGRLTWDSFWN